MMSVKDAVGNLFTGGKFSASIAVLTTMLMGSVVIHYWNHVQENPGEVVTASLIFGGVYLVIKVFEIMSSEKGIVTLALRKHLLKGDILENASTGTIAEALTDLEKESEITKG